MANKSLLDNVLNEILSVMADDVKTNVRFSVTSNGRNLPDELVTSVQVKAVTRRGERGISVSVNPDIPYARVYEWGSGLFRQKGRRFSKNQLPDGTIRIRPKNKQLLAFKWDKVSRREPLSFTKIGRSGVKYVGDLPDGRSAFNYVDHPGVMAANQGRGYLRPSVIDAFNDYSSMFSKRLSKEILDNIKVSFARRKK